MRPPPGSVEEIPTAEQQRAQMQLIEALANFQSRGNPAFPTVIPGIAQFHGMMLREWVASWALNGAAANHSAPDDITELVRNAFAIADEFVKRANEKPKFRCTSCGETKLTNSKGETGEWDEEPWVWTCTNCKETGGKKSTTLNAKPAPESTGEQS